MEIWITKDNFFSHVYKSLHKKATQTFLHSFYPQDCVKNGKSWQIYVTPFYLCNGTAKSGI